MFNYPWTNLHELNLDWIIQQVRDGLVDHGCAFVRPEDFPDSNDPIQEAIDIAANDGKIVLLSGAYNIENTLAAHDGTVIVGIHNATLSTHPQDVPGFAPTTIINLESNTLIYGVTFDGNRPEPSASIIPSDLEPGETLTASPLVTAYNITNTSIINCNFTRYDSNRTSSIPSYNFAVLALVNCENMHITDCAFTDILRECIAASHCTRLDISGCKFDMGDNPDESYTEIGLGLCDTVNIYNCEIRKGPNVTTSLINAMSDNVTIDGCTLIGISSSYGIDYGNEVAAGHTNHGLIIRNCYINCHISGASKYTINHDDIWIENNTIDGTDLHVSSGIIMVYGSNENTFDIRGNHFIGTLQTPTLQAITQGSVDIVLTIDNNHFETSAIRIGNVLPQKLTISSNVFEGDAIFQNAASTTQQFFTIIGSTCRRAGRFGSVPINSLVSCALIGCDFRRSVLTNAVNVDTSLSYIRGN